MYRPMVYEKVQGELVGNRLNLSQETPIFYRNIPEGAGAKESR